MKKIIINADDFGLSEKTNEAVKLGAQAGVITSASLLAGFSGFEHAVKEVLPQIRFINPGFHFNIIEGKSLTNPDMLTDSSGYFNRSWIEIMLKSPLKKFQKQLEGEFRAQLERILPYTEIKHIDSHVHTHAVPPIFDLAARLAAEYKIPYIRTQKEFVYKVSDIPADTAYAGGCIKNLILNTFTAVNKKRHPEIKTNDNFIGVIYSGAMTKQTILEGLKKIKAADEITEIIIHPSTEEASADNGSRKFNLPFLKAEASNSPRLQRRKEFEMTQDKNFLTELKQAGFELVSFFDKE